MEEKKIGLLIVDDEEQFLKSIGKRLEVRGFNVITVNRGEKAIEAARQHEIDVALVDLKMPGMNGEQTLQALKKEHQWMAIVILTGHASVDSAVQCTRMGANAYLQKPCDFDKLLEVLIEAYKTKVMNKMHIQEQKMDEMLEHFVGDSPLAILRKIKEMDKD